MKKQLSYALLSLSLVSFNIMPAKAVDDVLSINQTQAEVSSSGQWCVYIPWWGEFCWDL
jgi:hypothetical protein